MDKYVPSDLHNTAGRIENGICGDNPGKERGIPLRESVESLQGCLKYLGNLSTKSKRCNYLVCRGGGATVTIFIDGGIFSK